MMIATILAPELWLPLPFVSIFALAPYCSQMSSLTRFGSMLEHGALEADGMSEEESMQLVEASDRLSAEVWAITEGKLFVFRRTNFFETPLTPLKRVGKSKMLKGFKSSNWRTQWNFFTSR